MVRVICNEASLTGERAGIGTSDLNRAISISRIGHAPEVLRNLKTNIYTDYRSKMPSLYRGGIRKKTGEISSTTIEITSRTCLRRSRMKL